MTTAASTVRVVVGGAPAEVLSSVGGFFRAGADQHECRVGRRSGRAGLSKLFKAVDVACLEKGGKTGESWQHRAKNTEFVIESTN